MHIKPEVSTLINWFEIKDSSGSTEVRLPEVDTSNAETDIMIEDGKTIIIAGLIKESRNESQSEIPLLGDIPLLGNLFKSRYDSKKLKELVIFITPHIMSGSEDLFFLGSEKKGRNRRNNE
jgi:type IV pilus assembly protein PilQ